MFIFIQINLIKRFSQTYYETEIQQLGDGMFNIWNVNVAHVIVKWRQPIQRDLSIFLYEEYFVWLPTMYFSFNEQGVWTCGWVDEV